VSVGTTSSPSSSRMPIPVVLESSKKKTPTCHLCGVEGHVQPHCNRMFVSSKSKVGDSLSSKTKPIGGESPKKKVLTCHHCGVEGHIRPFCYRLKRESVENGQTQRPMNRFVPRSVILGQPNVGRPRGATPSPPKCQNDEFLTKLSLLATQSSYIVEEINKLSLHAKNWNNASYVQNKSNHAWKKVIHASHVSQPPNTLREFGGSSSLH
jgi:hypothetical protein